MKTSCCLVIALVLGGAAHAADDVPVVDEQAGEFTADALAFESRVQVQAACTEVFKSLTEFQRLQALVPHLQGKSPVATATKAGDALTYEFERADGSKNSGRLVLTTIEPGNRVQVLVQPEEGPWLRVQEFRLYAPAAGPKQEKECNVTYEETYNPKVLRNLAYNMKEIVQHVRKPYMEIILRRLKNLAEGKEPGAKAEVAKLKEIARNFP